MTHGIEPLTLRLTPERGRLAAAHLRWVVAPVRGIVCALVALCTLFLVVVQVLLGVPPSVIALAVIAACVLVAAYWVIAAHRGAPVGRSKVTLDGRGIARAGSAGNSTLGWERFERWLENDEEFLVLARIGRVRDVTLLPKADLDEATQDRVREFLDAFIDPDAEPLDDAFVEEEWDEDDDSDA